jgi:CRP/FNR family transcriptional regulator, cyclic AMP receptor protein
MLRTQDKLSDSFIAYILSHKNRVEEALIDQLFNSSGKRLARALLALGRYGKVQQQLDDELPPVSQETLSEIIGTTRSRVSFFMSKFRKLGFIEYHNRRIKINKSLLTFVLDE